MAFVEAIAEGLVCVLSRHRQSEMESPKSAQPTYTICPGVIGSISHVSVFNVVACISWVHVTRFRIYVLAMVILGLVRVCWFYQEKT